MFSSFRRVLSAGLLAAVMTYLLASGSVKEVSRADPLLLSQGKSYEVSYESPIERAFPKKKYRSEKKLTDGVLGSQKSYSDSALVQFYRGTTLYLTFDLEEICAVDRVEIRALQQKSAGITIPRNGSVSVSEDGVAFGTVGSFDESAKARSNQVDYVTVSVELDRSYRARFVRVSLSCDVFLYMDEVCIFGSADADAGVKAEADPETAPAGYAQPLDGIGSICLMYTVGNYSRAQLLPYFAYVDGEGQPKDTLYDGMLFLPSGASGFDFSSPDGWDRYMDELFGESEKTNLTALNDTVRQYAGEIGLPADYKYPVFLAIPKLTEGAEEFDGLIPLNLDNKLTIIRSMIDRMIRRFEDGSFDHLVLKGFYWHEELIPYSENGYAEDLASGFTSYVHEKGLKALWIPYYCAPGFEKARALGFDGPCLQAGYAFNHSQSENGDALAGACEDSAAQAYKFGLGIEFELDLNVKDFYKRFFKYVHTAYSTGCMENGLMTMYQGVTDIYKCAYSAADSDQRQVYELLYQYVHGTFESLPPVIAKGQFVAAKIGERTSGTLTVTDADSKKNALKLRDKEIPEGLTAVFEGDGFYLVNTQDTVPGVYRVRLTVSDGYNDSEPEEILVFVYDPDSNGTEVTLKNDLPVYATLQRTDPESIPKGEQVTCLPVENDLYYVLRSGEPAGMAYAEDLGLESVSSRSSDESVPNGNGSGINPLWIILPAAALVCAAAAVWLVIRKKKRNKGT